MDVPDLHTPSKKEDVFDGLLPPASDSPLSVGVLIPPHTGTGSTDSGKVAGQAGSPALVEQTHERPAGPAPPPLVATNARGDATVPMNAIQLEFSGRGSFVLGMLDHSSTCSAELGWTDWLREAKAVARGYPDAPGGT